MHAVILDPKLRYDTIKYYNFNLKLANRKREGC